MAFKPEFTPLVCPFCEQTCDQPADTNEHDASCGCGAKIVVDDEIWEDRADLEECAERDGKELDIRIVNRVDFFGPGVEGDREPPEPEGEWDGDWADALFYIVLP